MLLILLFLSTSLSYYKSIYIFCASSFRACVKTCVTLTLLIFSAILNSIVSFSFTSYEALATLLLTKTCPASHNSLATVLLLTSLDTFKYLSSRSKIYHLSAVNKHILWLFKSMIKWMFLKNY